MIRAEHVGMTQYGILGVWVIAEHVDIFNISLLPLKTSGLVNITHRKKSVVLNKDDIC